MPAAATALLQELTDADSPITYGVVKPGDEGDVPFVRGGDIADGVVREANLRTITSAVSQQYKRTRLRGGELLISLVGQPGQVAVAAPSLAQANIARQVGLIRLREGIDPQFVSYFLRSPDGISGLGKFTGGSVQQVINLSDLRRVRVPLLPLPAQRRVVAILDEAFAGIATAKDNAERSLQNSHAVFLSQLESIFAKSGEDWVEKPLDVVTSKIGSGATPHGGEASYKAEGVSLIRSLNVHDMGFRHKKLAFLDDDQASALSNVIVQSRDVLLNITGASVARCCVVVDDVLPARVNQHVSIIRVIPEVLDAAFLHFLLVSKPYKDRLLSTGEEGGSTRQAITKKQIQEFSVLFPEDLTKQREIVLGLNILLKEAQRLESIYTRKLTALDELKQSLLHQAFSGQL